MARRRRQKDADHFPLFVGITLFAIYLSQKYLETIQLIFALVIAGGIVAGFAYLLRRRSGFGHGNDFSPSPFPGQVAMRPVVEGRPTEWSLDLIRRLDWMRFEELCAAYFSAEGYKAKVTDLGADGGIDVLIYGKDNPDEIIGVAQCKAWSDKSVGVREIRELLGAMTAIGCNLGVYFSTSEYTQSARTFAESNNINLVDARQLLEFIKSLSPDSRHELLRQATSGDYTTPSCPSCGIKLVTRKAQSGPRAGQEFWGCSNYPRCKYTMRMKSADLTSAGRSGDAVV